MPKCLTCLNTMIFASNKKCMQKRKTIVTTYVM